MPKKENDFIEPIPMEAPQPRRSYKFMATIFFLIAIILLVAIFYLVLAKVTITVTPANEPVIKSFEMSIAESPENSTSTNPIIGGKVYVEKVSTEQEYQVSESQKKVEAQATGKATIYNTRDQAQTLVATTRLISKENVLFRLKDKVTVPASGEIEVNIYADKPGKSGEIGPTTFTIPGLSADLQTLIYAESREATVGGEKQIGILSEADIEKASADFKKTQLEKTMAKLTTGLETEKWLLVGGGIVPEGQNFSYDKKVGDEVDGFKLKGEMTVIAVFVQKQDILDKIKEIMNNKNEMLDVDESTLKYELLQTDVEKKEATAKIEISGLTKADENKNIFDKNMLVGFTESDLRLYFSQFNTVRDIRVEFSPFWVKKVPIFKDHIIIKMLDK
ncbi:hypothetical protein GYA54_03905 [Candidatus Kuenenbacteria bacterium]|nr:hypothetical protein [Candidatus Kuenenbacteria bacterium]